MDMVRIQVQYPNVKILVLDLTKLRIMISNKTTNDKYTVCLFFGIPKISIIHNSWFY